MKKAKQTGKGNFEEIKNLQETIINIQRHKMLKKMKIQAKDFYPTKLISHIKGTNCYQQFRTQRMRLLLTLPEESTRELILDNQND